MLIDLSHTCSDSPKRGEGLSTSFSVVSKAAASENTLGMLDKRMCIKSMRNMPGALAAMRSHRRLPDTGRSVALFPACHTLSTPCNQPEHGDLFWLSLFYELCLPLPYLHHHSFLIFAVQWSLALPLHLCMLLSMRQHSSCTRTLLP